MQLTIRHLQRDTENDVLISLNIIEQIVIGCWLYFPNRAKIFLR